MSSPFTVQQAVVEANRCLQCFEAPCSDACPTHIDIPRFIRMIRSRNIAGAAVTVRTANALANICGVVCPEEVFCQSVCNRAKIDEAIRIRELHFEATHDAAKRHAMPLREFPRNGKSVAVVGAGPSGLGCAFELAKLGYEITLYDGRRLAGVPGTSIPSFRLPDVTLHDDLAVLSHYFTFVQETVADDLLADLRRRTAAVFVAVGLGVDRPVGIPGERLPGVEPVLQFLERARHAPESLTIPQRVVVIGGGNVSLDAAAAAKHLGAHDVVLIYRRSEREMRVWKSELDHAREAGVEIRFLTLPIEFQGTDRVRSVLCRKTELSLDRDSSGRPVPVEVPGSEHILPAELVVVAIGQVLPSGLFTSLRRTARGYLSVDERFMTSEPGVFAGGDAIAGEGTIVQSVSDGKRAAHAIHAFVTGSE